jgi:SAM-dependent methyltransferase
LYSYGAIRNKIKPFIPERLRLVRGKWRLRKFNRAMAGKSSHEIFHAVYYKRIWGFSNERGQFSSGVGSREAKIVEPYIASVSQYVGSLPYRLDAVDLGCGDFAIGSLLRPLFNRYIGCDIVADLIARNRERYKSLDVDFQVINISDNDLPPGDIVLVRQVFQHLSNRDIARALERIRATYPRLILTEDIPLEPDFVPNVDIETGAGIRGPLNSGVDIMQAPFDVSAASTAVLCEITLKRSRIRTTLYNF